MRLTSTVSAFRALALLPGAEQRRAGWAAYEAVAPEAFAAYFAGWASRSRAAAAAEAAPDLLGELDDRERRAIAACGEAERVLREARLLGTGAEDDLDVVLLVGVGASNGWVDVLHERPTLFLALEVLPAPPYDVVLAVHEAVHAVAARRRPDAPWPEDVPSALIDEGLATAVSRRLVPGLDDSVYLWFDDEHADWVRACDDCRPDLVRRALELSSDEAPPDELFLVGRGDSLPHRAGYRLGERVVAELLVDHDPDDVLSWTAGRARAEVDRVLGGWHGRLR